MSDNLPATFTNGSLTVPAGAMVILLDRMSADERHAMLRGGIDYELYLRTEAWARLHSEVTRRQAGLCALCTRHASQVHHKHYRTIGCESPDDLVALCRWCHWGVTVAELLQKEIERGEPISYVHNGAWDTLGFAGDYWEPRRLADYLCRMTRSLAETEPEPE